MSAGGSDSERKNIGVNNNDNARLEESVTEVQQQHEWQLGDTDGTRAEEKDGTLKGESKGGIQKEYLTQAVKTKTKDGGSQATENNGSDAFSQYSNTNVRMMHLLGLDDAEEANEDNTDWQQLIGYQGIRRLREGGANQDGNARKTRLSTELHGSAFYQQLFAGNRQGRQE